MSLRIGDVDSSIAFSDGDFFSGVLTFLVLLQKNTKIPAHVLYPGVIFSFQAKIRILRAGKFTLTGAIGRRN